MLWTRNFSSVRYKIVSLQDAVSLVKARDTLCVSGFVAQSCPGLGQRTEGLDLTLLFGGGPGDWGTRGLNHLAHHVSRTIGSHYGQVPALAQRVLANKVAGSSSSSYLAERLCISSGCNQQDDKVNGFALARLYHFCGTRYLYRSKLAGTMVDPQHTGGCLNELARSDPLLESIRLDNHNYIRYPALPIDICFIRATTGDPEGNLRMEHESILGDCKNIAMATRSSGGLVIAQASPVLSYSQVQRIAAHGSLHARDIDIPGSLVDCVVVAETPDEHCVSFETNANPFWTGEIRKPLEDLPTMLLSARKLIARRAAIELKPDDIVNLGIGVASVASEEGIYSFVTLTTEAGVIGGIPASGKNFGPAANCESFNEMNQQFDLYNGGGLSVAFLGMAQVSGQGNVNVSRISDDSLTGPGGFIDITQCTHRVVFLGTFMKKGLKVNVSKGKLEIVREGSIPTFVENVREITFAADQALRAGQSVLYVTERCVFELNFRGLKLVEIAPGIDLDRDILAHMSPPPYFKSRDNIKLMDSRIFEDKPMELFDDLFSLTKQFVTRLQYREDMNTFFIDLKNISIQKLSDVHEVEEILSENLEKCTAKSGRKPHVIANYDGFDCKPSLTEQWAEMVTRLQSKYYQSAKRYSGHVFRRQVLKTKLKLESDDEYWESFTKSRRVLSRTALRTALKEKLYLRPTIELVEFLMKGKEVIQRDEFDELIDRLNYYRHHNSIPGS